MAIWKARISSPMPASAAASTVSSSIALSRAARSRRRSSSALPAPGLAASLVRRRTRGPITSPGDAARPRRTSSAMGLVEVALDQRLQRRDRCLGSLAFGLELEDRAGAQLERHHLHDALRV